MAALTTTPVTPVTPNVPVPFGTTDEILLTACERCERMAEYRQRAACLLCSLQIAQLATGQEEDTCTGKMPPPFQPTTVDDGIATISLRVPGNGHVHRLKVPEDALSFLQDLWSRTPFKVSTRGKAKKTRPRKGWDSRSRPVAHIKTRGHA